MHETINDQKALRAQHSTPQAVEELWQHVRPLACWIARRYAKAAECFGAVDADDLQQMAALGMLRALATWDPSAGSFAGWLAMHVRTECRKGLGLAGRIRVEQYASTSLDAPFDDDGNTLAALIPDSSSPGYEEAELRTDLSAALARLPPQEAAAIRLHDLEGIALTAIAQAEQAPLSQIKARRSKALQRLRRDRRLRESYCPNYMRRKSLAAFNTTFSSIVEDEVLHREEYQQHISERSI